MLTVKVIASGSTGNSYLIADPDGNKLLLECGIPFQKIQKALDFNFKGLDGCLLTHEHKDHSKAVKDVLRAGIDVYTSVGTARKLGIENEHRYHCIKSQKAVIVGRFWQVVPLEAKHDAAEPMMFLIFNFMTNDILFFATDTYYVPYKLPKPTNYVMVECNYDMEHLNNNINDCIVEQERKSRIIHSHMNLSTCKELFKANEWNCCSGLNEVWLIHLSRDNSDEAKFINEIEAVTGVPVYTA